MFRSGCFDAYRAIDVDAMGGSAAADLCAITYSVLPPWREDERVEDGEG